MAAGRGARAQRRQPHPRCWAAGRCRSAPCWPPRCRSQTGGRTGRCSTAQTAAAAAQVEGRSGGGVEADTGEGLGPCSSGVHAHAPTHVRARVQAQRRHAVGGVVGHLRGQGAHERPVTREQAGREQHRAGGCRNCAGLACLPPLQEQLPGGVRCQAAQGAGTRAWSAPTCSAASHWLESPLIIIRIPALTRSCSAGMWRRSCGRRTGAVVGSKTGSGNKGRSPAAGSTHEQCLRVQLRLSPALPAPPSPPCPASPL